MTDVYNLAVELGTIALGKQINTHAPVQLRGPSGDGRDSDQRLLAMSGPQDAGDIGSE